MTKTKFTPGPWVAVSRGFFGDVEEGDVHEKKNWDVGMDDGEFMRGNFRMEDAHLISAAPELYDALQACLDHGSMTGYDFVIEQAHAALAKARGEA